ncbi:MAG: universal stress protein [Synergistales bacterium]
MPKRILVCLDFSKLGDDVVTYGHRLAHRLDAEVTFIHVIEFTQAFKGYGSPAMVSLPEAVRTKAREKIELLVMQAEAKMPTGKDHRHPLVVREGEPAEEIIALAKEGNFDLVVVGNRGNSRITSLVVGSTASKVARYAPCSVLIYRPGHEPI